MRVAVVGDVGCTGYSVATMVAASNSALFDESLLGAAAGPPALLLLPGDLSYADGDGASWDAWGEAMAPVLRGLPLVAVPGNHEVEVDRATKEAFVHWRERFRMPEALPEEAGPGTVT